MSDKLVGALLEQLENGWTAFFCFDLKNPTNAQQRELRRERLTAARHLSYSFPPSQPCTRNSILIHLLPLAFIVLSFL